MDILFLLQQIFIKIGISCLIIQQQLNININSIQNQALQMLGVCNSLANCKSESSIRHKVRKLRAKVRALIPTQVCNSHKKRNEQVQKINFRRTQQTYYSKPHSNGFVQDQKNHGHANQFWKYGSTKTQEWYTTSHSQKGKNNNINYEQFKKLTIQQIQQINEDKLYYLGQSNVQSYNFFLRTLKAKGENDAQQRKQHKSIKSDKKQSTHQEQNNQRQIVSISLWDQCKFKAKNVRNEKRNKSIFKSRFTCNNFGMYSTSSLQKDNKIQNHRNSTTNISKWNTDSQNNGTKRVSICHKLFNKCQNAKGTFFKTNQQRKQQIQQEEKQKRMYQKLRMDIQMTKAQANQRQIKYKQYSKIKQIKQQQKQRHEKAIKKKSILMKKGQIIKIDEELRSLMLMRRANNRKQHGRSNSCVFQPHYSTVREV